MKLKKINAALGLLSMLCMLLHMGYSAYAYLTFYYNPVMKWVFALPFMILCCLHAVCGMLTVFLNKDGGRADLYTKQNIRTIIQRTTAALIFPLLILHINTFALMQKAAGKGQSIFIILLIIAEIVFFGAVVTHVAVSVSRGLITLGLLASAETQKKTDLVVYNVCAIFFAVAVFAVVKGQIAMFFAG